MRLTAIPLLAAAALTAAPTIRDITPRGGQRGKSVKLVLKGSELEPGSTLRTTIPGSVSRLVPAKDGELPFLIELAKDAPLGVYPLRLVTSNGLSNVMLFSVGGLPEIDERDSSPAPAPEPAAPQIIPTAAVVNGSLEGAGVDHYAIDVKAGQKLVFEVEASAIGSAIDPALEILDAAGKTVAKNNDSDSGIDVRVEHTFAAAGRYTIRVHDAKYSAQSANFYRMKVGSYSYADAIFPLGWKRGEPVTVAAVGGNLPRAVDLKPDTSANSKFTMIRVPGSESLPFLFELGDAPESLEPAGAGPHALSAGTVINGRVAKKGEVDRYKLAVKPGAHWVFELRAASLGSSRLDALITVYDAAGKKLASRDDLGGADPVLPFEVPKDVAEVTVAVEDLLGRGGPAYGYRLMARNEPADFVVRLNSPFVNVPAGGTAIVNATVQRRGYDGAIRVTIPNLPKGFRAAGGHVAPSYAQQRFDDPNPLFNTVTTTLTITADADAPPTETELTLLAVADTPLGRIERTAEGPGLVVAVNGLRQKALTARWLEMQLPMALSKPLPVKLSTPVPHVRLAQGVEYPLGYKVERAMGASVRGNVRDIISSAVGNLRILQGAAGKPDSGALMVNTNFATPMTKFDMLQTITAEIDGKPVDIYAPMVTFEVAQGFRVTPSRDAFTIAPGGKFTIAGSVYREPTFEGGSVVIEAQDLPEGVTCASSQVDAAARTFEMTCQSAASAAKGAHEFQIAAHAPDTGRKAKDTYRIPALAAKLRIE